MRLPKMFCLGLLLFGFTFVGSPLHATDAKAPKLISEWLLESKSLKRNGLRAKKGVHGKVVGSLDVHEDSEGTSLYFDGGNDLVVVGDPHPRARKALPGREFTLEAWVSVNTGQRWTGIVSCVRDQGDEEHGWILGLDENQFYFGLSTEGASDGNGKFTFVRGGPYERGRWHHVVATYDATTMQLFVDGTKVGESRDQSGRILYPDATTYAIGAFKDDNEEHLFHGRMRYVGVYRTAATPEWIAHRFSEREKLTKLEPFLGDDIIAVVDGRSRQRAIDQAIERGTAYLLEKIGKKRVGDPNRDSASQVAFETYALLVAGVPVDHKTIQSNLDHLESAIYQRRNTYGLSSYIFALDAAIAQLEYEQALLEPFLKKDGRAYARAAEPLRKELKKAVEALLRSQQDSGGFRYHPHDKTTDNSCTQFAVLAMGVGHKRKVPIPIAAWEKLVQYFIDLQQLDGKPTYRRVTTEEQRERQKAREAAEKAEEDGEDEVVADDPKSGETGVAEDPKKSPVPRLGSEEIEVHARGWGYVKREGFNWNMTCAGVSSMILIRDALLDRGMAKDANKLRRSIWDGCGWMMENWNPTGSYYAMYSLEKVADLGGIALFDGRDWYEIVSDRLLNSQIGDGSWIRGHSHGEEPRIATSFALLILKRATTLMTRDPRSRVIYTGSGSTERSVDDRNWVYIPELETSVNAPQILGAVRARPAPQWLSLLESICRNYQEPYRFELVPGLMAIRAKAGNGKIANRLAEGCLTLVIGETLPDNAAIDAWYERTRDVVAAWEAHDFGAIPKLIEQYGAVRTVQDKRLIVMALTRLSADEAIDAIFEDLTSENEALREFAYRAIVGLSPTGIPRFEGKADEETRARQLQELRRWLDAREKSD